MYELELIFQLDFNNQIEHYKCFVSAFDLDTAKKIAKQSLINYLTIKYSHKYYFTTYGYCRDFIKKHLQIISYNYYRFDFTVFINEYHD